MADKPAKKLPLGKGALEIRVAKTYRVSPTKLWDAITKAEHVQRFFVDKVEGDFTPERTPVVWEFKKWGRFTLWPAVVQVGKKLEYHWADHKDRYLTTVTFTLTKSAGRTKLEIHERGWRQADLANAFDNCSGWTMYVDYLKAYLLHGLDLRK